jgi:hypothetical protein
MKRFLEVTHYLNGQFSGHAGFARLVSPLQYLPDPDQGDCGIFAGFIRPTTCFRAF